RTLQRLALSRGPRSDLAEAIATGEISVGFLVRDLRHGSLDSDLNVDRRPVKAECGDGMREQMSSLSPLIIRVEDEPALVERFQQDDSHRRLPAFLDGTERHRVGLTHDSWIDFFGASIHFAESFDRIGWDQLIPRH